MCVYLAAKEAGRGAGGSRAPNFGDNMATVVLPQPSRGGGSDKEVTAQVLAVQTLVGGGEKGLRLIHFFLVGRKSLGSI